jgi:hypothetical protein
MAYNPISPNFFSSKDLKANATTKWFVKLTNLPESPVDDSASAWAPPFHTFESVKDLFDNSIKDFINKQVARHRTAKQLSKLVADKEKVTASLIKTQFGDLDATPKEAEDLLQKLRSDTYENKHKTLVTKLDSDKALLTNPELILLERLKSFHDSDPAAKQIVSIISAPALLREYKVKILIAFDTHRRSVVSDHEKAVAEAAKKAKDDDEVNNLLKRLHDDPKLAEVTLGKLVDGRIQSALAKANLLPPKPPKNEPTPPQGREQAGRGNRARGRGGRARGRGRGARSPKQSPEDRANKPNQAPNNQDPNRRGSNPRRGQANRGQGRGQNPNQGRGRGSARQ